MFSTTLLIGRVGADPELRYTSSGDTVTTFSVATTGKWVDSNGESNEKVSWHKVTAWKKLAELANEYLRKGRLVFIQGEIVNNSWTNKQGQKQYSTEIHAKRILFLDSNE